MQVAKQLAAANASVILKSVRCFQFDIDRLRCSDDSAVLLTHAGVLVGIATDDNMNPRNLRFDAGLTFQRAAGKLTTEQALAMTSFNLAEMFGVQHLVGTIEEGKPANFVVFSGDPMAIGSQTALVAVRDRLMCQPDPDGDASFTR